MGLISAIGELTSTGINSNSGRMSKRKMMKLKKTKQGEVQGPVKHLPTDLDAVEEQMMSENPTPEGREIKKLAAAGHAQRQKNITRRQ